MTSPNRILRENWPLLAICAAYLLLSPWYLAGGSFDVECYVFLPHYLGDKSLLQKLYDSRYTDHGLYQGRELSYLFDYLDWQFADLSARLGRPHFLSLTTHLFTLGILCLSWFLSRRLGLSRPISALLLALFITCPIVLHSGSIFRSAKIGVAFLTTLACYFLYRRWTADRIPPLDLLAFTLLCSAMVLFDKQGVFFTGLLFLFLTAHGLASRGKPKLALAAAAGAALLFSFAYNSLLAPALTQTLNGYTPDLKYQKVPLTALREDPLGMSAKGAILLIDTLRFTLGCLPQILAALLLPLILWLATRTPATNPPRRWLPPALAAILTALLVLMYILMALRHPDILRPELRRQYYGLPAMAALLLTLTLALRGASLQRIPQRYLTVLLALALLGNLYALPRHHAIRQVGYASPMIYYSPEFLEAIRLLSHDVVTPAGKSFSQDPVYHFFAARLLRNTPNPFATPTPHPTTPDADHN